VAASVYWRRATRPGAIASVIAMAVTWLLLFRASGYGAHDEYLFLGMMPVATIFACSLLTLVAVSLLTKPPSEATLRRFFPPGAAIAGQAPVTVPAAGD